MPRLGLGLTVGRTAWWPEGAVFAADFVNRRYMRAGAPISEGEAFSVSRASAAWADDGEGGLVEFGVNEPRFTRSGLLLEPARTRLSLAPVEIGGPRWSNSGGATVSVLPPEGMFTAPARIFSGGFEYSRRNSTALSLTAGSPVHIKVRYRAGSSGNFGVYMRSNAADVQSMLSGTPGALNVSTISGGLWAGINNVLVGGNVYETSADFTPNTTQSDWQFGLSPRSPVLGVSTDVSAASVVNGAGPSTWVLGDPSVSAVRAGEAITIDLQSAGTASLVFDDSSTQAMTVSLGTFLVSATAVNRAVVRSISVLA